MAQYSTDTVWVGMDVHQDSVTAAVLFGDASKPQVERLPGDLNAVRRMFRGDRNSNRIVPPPDSPDRI